MTSLINTTIGSCKISCVGCVWGVGVIYLATQPMLNRTVAVKIIRSDVAQNPGFIQRFEHEARTLASLEHPHILPLFEYGYQKELAYFVMPYITGGTLRERILQKPLTVADAIRVLEQLASALDLAHRRAIVHRDIKPANVLLRDDGWPLLADFGIAKLVAEMTHVTANPVGTPLYMAPEQWKGRSVSAQTDIYALGIMLYELLTSTPPFKGENWGSLMNQHLNTMPGSIRSLNPNVPGSLEQVIFKAIAKDPAERFANVLQFASLARRAIVVEQASTFQLPLAGSAPTILPGVLPQWRLDPFEVPLEFNPHFGIPPTLPVLREKEKEKQPDVSPTATTDLPDTVLAQPEKAPQVEKAQVPTQQLREIPLMITEWKNLSGAVDTLTMDPKMNRVYAGISNNILLWEPGRIDPLAQLIGHTRAVWALIMSSDGQLLISGSWDKSVRIWDTEHLQQKRVLLGHSDFILGLTLAMSEHMLISVSRDSTIRCWELPSGRQIRTIRHPGGAVWSVLTLPSDNMIIAGSESGTIGMWNLKNGQMIWNKSLGEVGVVQRLLMLPSQQVLCLTEKGVPMLLDSNTGTFTQVPVLPVPSPDYAVAIGSDVIYANVSGSLYRWNTENGLNHFVAYAHLRRVLAMAVQLTTGIIATGGEDRSLKLWQFF